MIKHQKYFHTTQEGPDWNITNKRYPNSTTTTTTITIDPSKLCTHQTNGTPNGNPTGDLKIMITASKALDQYVSSNTKGLCKEIPYM